MDLSGWMRSFEEAERAYERAMERHGLSFEESESSPRSRRFSFDGMRECHLLAKGRGSVYIQEKLYISQHTVKTHTYHIYKKLGVNSREELLTLIEQTTIADPPAVADGNSERAKERCD